MEAGAVHFKSLSGKTYILLLGYQSEEPSQSDLVSQVCRPTKKDKKRIGCGGHRCKFALMSFLKSFIHLEANK